MNKKKTLSIALLVVIVIGITIGVFSYASYSPVPVSQQDQSRTLPQTQIILSENPELELLDSSDELSNIQKSAILSVQNFKGNDDSGKSIAEILADIINSKYPPEVIKDQQTKIGWAAFSNEDHQNLVGVSFSFDSSEDDFSFIWYVNTDSGSITPATDGARELMNLVE